MASNLGTHGMRNGQEHGLSCGLRTTSLECRDLDPLRIKGLILHQPFFGASQRSESELRFGHDRLIPLRACDMAWQCSLPLRLTVIMSIAIQRSRIMAKI